jgi:hypothetical protein
MLPELLSKVFALSDYSQPISGPLLAYTRVSRYRHICITTTKKLQALCDLIAMDRKLGAFVQVLAIRLGTEESPTKREMVALYHSLDKLESLEVSEGSIDLILSHDIASTCFPHLDRLELDLTLEEHDNSLHPARFSCIEHYRELTFLVVIIWCYGSEPGEDDDEWVSESDEEGQEEEEEEEEEYRGGDEDDSEVDNDGRREQLSTTYEQVARAALRDRASVGSPSEDSEDDYEGTILQLHLTAPASDPRTLAFVERFTSLVSLTLIDSDPYESDFTPFLSHYSRASSIERLSLVSPTEDPNDPNPLTPQNDIAAGLKRFTSLESLVVETQTFSPAIFQHLCDPLPLTHLSFGAVDMPISIPDLKALFLPGPTRLTCLESLSLDILYPGEVGTCIEEEGLYYEGRGGPGPHPDWVLPSWSEDDDFDYDEVEALQALAEEAGVTFSGSILDAMEVMQLWFYEIMTAEEYGEGGDSERWDEDGYSDELDEDPEGQDDSEVSPGASEE